MSMRIFSLFVCCIVLVGCSRGSSPLPAALSNGAAPASEEAHAAYKLLYSFKAPPDGNDPFAGLIEVNGKLYGTTYSGGRSGNLGTIFEVSRSGAEHVVYSFNNIETEGDQPEAALIAMNGAFYGTTTMGGDGIDCVCGTVFEESGGTDRVLHSFKGTITATKSKDGASPLAGLVAVNRTLYGTTSVGGKSSSVGGNGIIFKVSTSGKEQVLYRFKGRPDGANPDAGLIDVNGTLYGTTVNGGDGKDCACGTIFEVTTSGKEHVLYSFKGTPDGATPFAGLVAVNGTLYGTTSVGGASDNGTVFEVSTSGKERVLYSFKGYPTDGADPYAGLTDLNGVLYGTTKIGGKSGNGTVFEVSMSGKERLLYSFKGIPDGAQPYAGLVAVDGKLYGTTEQGGANAFGTIFEVSP
jgi:uncharacterized repeat protein (TIGR03803 family)